jgi:hippurate hydrolase
MDALNVTELNQCEHASTHAGRMHACGHDGHTSMLLGAAQALASAPDFAGTVHFIFQPAEENEGGARAMIEDGLFKRFPWTRSTACTTGRACPWVRRRCIPRP